MRLADLIAGLPLGVLVDGDAEVSAICTDDRRVTAGALFFAREGWSVDSHVFLTAALAAGASVLVVTRPEAVPADCPVPVLLSSAEDRDLGLLAARFFAEPTDSLRTYGVTGTNGKTSVSFVLEHMLRAIGERPAIIGTVTHRFEDRAIPARNTTPDGLLIHGFARESIAAGATALVLEVSSHGAYLGRIAGAAFDSVGFTNLTAEHLDFHGDLEAYRSAKQLLFSDALAYSVGRGKRTAAAAFVDDPVGATMLAATPVETRRRRVSLVSTEADVHFSAVESLGAHGVRFEAAVDGRSFEGVSPLIGEHNLANVALALGMLAATHPDRVDDAIGSLADFAGIPGRYEAAVTPLEREAGVFIDYAHTPDAIRHALGVLGGLAPGETTVVLGCGGDRDRAKRAPMLRAAFEGADRVIVTSDNPRGESPDTIIDEMEQGLDSEDRERLVRVVERSAAIERAVRLADGPVLVAGKGHESYQEIEGRRYHLDDGEEVRRVFAALRDGVASEAQALLSGWSLDRIAQAVGGRVTRRGPVRGWGALTLDSRAVRPGGIFVAVRGVNHDGHGFVADAVRAGAALLLVERSDAVAAANVSVLEVDDVTASLGALASALLDEARRRQGGLTTIAVTGSNGKTTVKEMLRRLVGPAALVTPGNLNNAYGVPLSTVPVAPWHRLAVLELGANTPTDIEELSRIVRPDVGVVTSIGLAHVEGFGDIDGVRRAKAGLLRGGAPAALVIPLSEASHAIWRDAASSAGSRLATFGGPGADIEVLRRSPTATVQLVGNGELAGWRAEIELELPGRHNAENLAAALLALALSDPATGLMGGADVSALMAGLELPDGRLRFIDIGGRTLIDDAYNANPASVAASLDLLASFASPRIAVLGDMLELGDDEADLHREVGARAAAATEQVVAVGDRGRWIAEGAGADARHFISPEAAAAWLGARVSPGAVVMLKASRGVGLESMIEVLRASWERGE